MALPTGRIPVIKQGWLRALLFFIAYMGCLLLSGLLAGILMVVSGQAQPGSVVKNPLSDASLITWILIANALAGIVVAIVFRLFIDRRSLLSLGFSWRGREALVGFLLGPAILGVGTLILQATGHLHWTDITFQARDLFIGMGLLFITAVGEEVIFRGYLLNNLLESFHKWAALVITAALFAIVHVGNSSINAIALINLFAGGLILGINYIYTRNLWFSIFFHFSWNFFQGPVLGYEVSGLGLQSVLQQELSGPAILTGDHFGFEGSLIDTGLSVITIILLYLVFKSEPRFGGIKRIGRK